MEHSDNRSDSQIGDGFVSSSTGVHAFRRPEAGGFKGIPQTVVRDRYWLHLLLFVLTLASTVYAGATMAGRYEYYSEMGRWISILGIQANTAFLLDGLRFGGSLLLFLTVHEFGHYFAARHHSVSTSLPYYIPFPLNGIGTFGAVIRIRQEVPSMRKLFDIGAAGPLAGFVVALIVLLVGLFTLPGLDYIMGLPGHEILKDYVVRYGAFPNQPTPLPGDGTQVTLVVGSTPLYWLLTRFFSDVPPMWEMYHYPVLFAGWLGLFFTALNLLPVGQLDGGHMLYALVGPRWHRLLARGFVLMLLISGGIGFLDEIGPALDNWFGAGSGPMSWLILSAIMLFYIHRVVGSDLRLVIAGLFGVVSLVAIGHSIPVVVSGFGYSGWLFWCLLIVLLIRVDHPPVAVMEPLTPGRKRLALLGMFIFALCFSIKPLYIL